MWTPDLVVGVVLACLGAALFWAIAVGEIAVHIHDYWCRHHPRHGG